MKVHDDGPDQTQNNGWLAVHDVRDIDVHQFDLQGKDVNKVTDVDISSSHRSELKLVLEGQRKMRQMRKMRLFFKAADIYLLQTLT